MSEASETRAYVADWLRQVPEFMEELGIEDSFDLASRLEFLGSGASSNVVFLGERDGVKQVLKITSDSAQAALSQAALEDEPVGVVPIYAVVETDVAPRTPKLPLLAPPGEEPIEQTRTWGVIEQFTVPIDQLVKLTGMRITGERVDVLYNRYTRVVETFDTGQTRVMERSRWDVDPLATTWLQDMSAAIEWVEDTCVAIGSAPQLDLHSGNWGVDPETGDLYLIDLGQCYAVSAAPEAAE